MEVVLSEERLIQGKDKTIFNVNFEQISQIVLVFPLLTLNKKYQLGNLHNTSYSIGNWHE